MIRPPGPVAADPPPASGRRSTPAATIQPSTTPTPPGIGPVAAIQDRGTRAHAGVPGDDRVLRIEDERAVRVHEFGQAALDPPVRLQRPVAVQVVGGDVRVERRRSCRATGSAAGARTARRPRDGRESARAGARRSARRCSRPAPPGGTGPRRGSRPSSDAVVVLPLVPVTPIVGATHSRRNRSGSETSAGAPGSPAARAATSAASAARSRGSVVGKSGLIDGEVVTSAAPAQAVAGSTSGPSASVDRSTVQRRDRAGRVRPPDGRRRSSRERPASARNRARAMPAPGEPQDRHRLVAERAGPDGRHRQGVGIDRGVRRLVTGITAAGPATRGTASRPGAPPGSRRSRSGS